MTLRQLLVRVRALPQDSPLWQSVAAEQARTAEAEQVREIDDVLAMVQPPKEG